MSDENITGGLDLLGDWLDAKGYTEEAGLCTRAMDEINRLREENEKLKRRIHLFKNTRNEQVFEKLMQAHEENERLKQALEPFAKSADDVEGGALTGVIEFNDLHFARYVLRGERR